MMTSTRSGKLPMRIAVPPPHGVTAESASMQMRKTALTCSAFDGEQMRMGSIPSTARAASSSGWLVTAAEPSSASSRLASRSWLSFIFGPSIGAIEEIHEVVYFHIRSVLLRPITELQHTAGIGRDDRFGSRLSDRGHFIFQKLL